MSASGVVIVDGVDEGSVGEITGEMVGYWRPSGQQRLWTGIDLNPLSPFNVLSDRDCNGLIRRQPRMYPFFYMGIVGTGAES